MTGFDWAFIDTEHAPFTPVLLANIINAISTTSGSKTIPVVRVPAMEPSFISTALNAGAAGIVRPHTETKEEALQLIDACRYPPLGKRSYGPWAWLPGVNDAVPEGKVSFTSTRVRGGVDDSRPSSTRKTSLSRALLRLNPSSECRTRKISSVSKESTQS